MAVQPQCRGLAVDGVAEVLDGPLQGLPGFADNVLVYGDGALGRHAQGMGLPAHLGRKVGRSY